MRFKVASLLAVGFSLGVVQAASAADMPTKAPAYAPVALYNWTGFYVGGHIGGAWSNTTVADVTPPAGIFAFPATRIGLNGSGFLGGVQLGYNWQTGPWVFGLQGDIAWTGINANGVDPDIAGLTLIDKIDWVGTASGRIGYAWNTLLFYGKGGAAWVHNKYSSSGGVAGSTVSGSETRTGWLIGGGLEYAFARNWTAFVEYDYIGLGTHTTTVSLSPSFGVTTAQASIQQNLNLAKLGINYKF